jgi:hypothetical protein
MDADETLDLESRLRRCAADLSDDFPTVSMKALSELMGRVRGTPVEAEAHRVFERFLVDGSANEVRLAAACFNPLLLDVGALDQAMARRDLPATALKSVRGGLGRALVAQPSRFATQHRELLAQPGGEVHIGAAIIADRAWFLDHVKDVLGGDAEKASERLWFGLQLLDDAEAKRLRDELEARRSALGDAYVRSLFATIDDHLAR